MSIPSPRDSHGRMMTTEWSFPRSTLSPQRTSKQHSCTRWALIILGIISILGLAPVIFCLVLIAMGSMTLVIELLSLLSAALVLIVGVILIALWAISCIFSTRWRNICFGICAGLLALNACFGLATWIVMIVERGALHDPLDSKTAIFGRERIIAAGFASWGLVLVTQIAFIIILAVHTSRTKFDPSTQVRSSGLSSLALSPSNSVIPMRRATIHHHPSITSLPPSRLSHRLTQSWTSPPTSPMLPPTMPIANLSTPSLNPHSSLPNFPLPPSAIIRRSKDSFLSLQISQATPPYPTDSLASFPFRDSIVQSSSSLPIFPTETRKHKRNSGILKSLTIRPESPQLRKKTSLSSLPTPTFPSLSPRKRFKFVEETLSHSESERTVWDEWQDEDPRVRERVEMSFESVRLEKSEPKHGGLGIAGTPIPGGMRNVSSGSGIAATPMAGTPAEMGWMNPEIVLNRGV